MVVIVATLFVAIAFACGLWLGAAHAHALWVERSTVQGGLLKECSGAQYFVADRNDPEACCRLLEWLHIEQERRESADAMRRMQGL